MKTYKWDDTKKGDQNSFFLILLTLSWWHTVVKTDIEEREWMSAVEKMTWALREIISGIRKGEKGGKRKASMDADAGEDVDVANSSMGRKQ